MAFIVKKDNKIFRTILILNAVVIVAFLSVGYLVESKLDSLEVAEPVQVVAKSQEKWFDQYNLVAHAMGGIDGTNYTNSVEAFLSNYGKGFRVFEADLSLTADSKLVSIHKWTSNFPLSEKTFMSNKVNGKYEPINLDKLMEYMYEYKDIYVITDLKNISSKELVQFQINEIVNTAKSYDERILNRLVFQVYNQEMYKWVDDTYKFKNYVYTLYKSEDTEDEIVKFVQDNNISVVTCEQDKATGTFVGRLSSLGKVVFVHTINDTETFESLKQKGIQGVYTDFLVPNMN